MPSTDQFTLLFAELNCCICPVAPSSVAELGETTTWGITVTAACALLEVEATLVAVTVCDPGWEGALYTPDELIVPVVELPPVTPSTDHVTAVLLEPVTVALNGDDAPTTRFTDF
mgnify:CR=1 FL=1